MGFHFVSAAPQHLMPVQLEERTLVLCVITRSESASHVRLSIFRQTLEPCFEQLTDCRNTRTGGGICVCEAAFILTFGPYLSSSNVIEQGHSQLPSA